MTPAALLLVLCAAALHATWNLMAKKVEGGLPFAFLMSTVTTVLYVPVIALFCWWTHPALTPAMIAWMAGSGLLKAGYLVILYRGYRLGDFSLVYPLARGSAPLIAAGAAIALFGERPGALAILGAILIVAGIFHLTDGAALFRESRAHVRTAVRYGTALGIIIAAFTLWDKHGVGELRIPPLLYDSCSTCMGAVLLSPFAFRNRSAVAADWRRHRLTVVGISAFSALAYVLILTALSFTPVSYVAPVREVSIVIGAFFGARVLREGEVRRRTVAAVGIAAGIVALAAG